MFEVVVAADTLENVTTEAHKGTLHSHRNVVAASGIDGPILPLCTSIVITDWVIR